MKKIVFFVLTCLLLVSCDNSRIVNSKDGDIATIDTSCVAILQYDPTDFMFKNFFSEPVSKHPVQALTLGEKRLLDDKLYEFLALQVFEDIKWYEQEKKMYPNENFKLINFLIHMEDYRRQYAILKNKRGERIVWCIFVCEGILRHVEGIWKVKPFIGFGGGNCLFNFKVNLATGKCYDIWVNAEA